MGNYRNRTGNFTLGWPSRSTLDEGLDAFVIDAQFALNRLPFLTRHLVDGPPDFVPVRFGEVRVTYRLLDPANPICRR